MDQDQMQEIITILQNIKEDLSIPKNIKERLNQTIQTLCLNNCDDSMKIDKALEELDNISDDPNIPTYTRIEVLNVISVLGGSL